MWNVLKLIMSYRVIIHAPLNNWGAKPNFGQLGDPKSTIWTPTFHNVREIGKSKTTGLLQSPAYRFRLDYCNAMLYGAPANTFDILQRAQNNLARVVCQSGGRTDAKRVTYKMATLTFKVLSSSTPAYLNDLIQSAVPGLFGLWDLPTPRCCLLQEHELNSHGGHSQLQLHTPGTRYHLTLDLNCHTLHTFKKHLKTHLFRQS